MPLTDALRRHYASAPDDSYHIHTLQLDHPGFPGGVRYLTNEKGGWQGRDEGAVLRTFEFVPFEVKEPDSDSSGVISMPIVFDNASRALMQNLETIAEQPTDPIVCTYRIYLSHDPEVIQNAPALVTDILSVVATQLVITANASQDNLRTKPFPAFLYDTNYYPGLAR